MAKIRVEIFLTLTWFSSTALETTRNLEIIDNNKPHIMFLGRLHVSN